MRLAKEERLRRLGFHIEDLSKADEYRVEEDGQAMALRRRIVAILKAHGFTAKMIRAVALVWFRAMGYREAGREMGIHHTIVDRYVTTARTVLAEFKTPLCATVCECGTVGVWLLMPIETHATLTNSL